MRRASARHDAFVVCVPGLEAVVGAELAALGVRTRRPVPGGVPAWLSTREVYAANLWLRSATRVVVTVAEFACGGMSELERHAARLPWDDWLPAGGTLRVRATAHGSRIFHTGALAERLAEGAGRPLADDGPLVVARMDRDRLMLRLDTSGDPLHRRGWRQAVAKAPLRESLAAALLLAVGWDGTVPLVDPFCGSGTIAIEAATMARRLAPGRLRRYAFEAAPGFEPGTWASVVGAARAGERGPGGGPSIVAADRDAGAVAAAVANAERAGVADDLEVRRAGISELVLPGPAGWVVTNPPYGRRIGGGDLRDLYARFGQVVRAGGPGWRVGMLVADAAVAGHSGLDLADVRLRLDNGGIPVQLRTTPAAPDTPEGHERSREA